MPVMNDRVREQLIGYLLGALEDEEQQALQEQLKHDQTLQRNLAEIQKILSSLRARKVEFRPPLGLTRRTCQWVTEQTRPKARPRTLSPGRQPVFAAARAAAGPAVASSSWGWLDLVVAASILVAGFLLVFPAIESSRSQARITACQDNLRQVGMALADYSDRNGGYFPYVPPKGPLAAAGVYAPILLDGGYLTQPSTVVCPGSPTADRDRVTIPTLSQLQSAEPGEKLDQLQSTMGGSYGYSLGYVSDGRYWPTRNLARPMFAVMADAPNYGQPQFQSLNHGGRGQNVLFEDGHVAFLPTPKPNQEADDLFLNDTGQVAAGTHQNDSVVSASGATPFESAPPASPNPQ